jgi:dihydroxyacetone kinase-like protein
MERSGLTVEETVQMMIHVSRRVQESENLLTRADQVVGDGDHGVGMARGFVAVQRLLESHMHTDIGDVFQGIGRSLMTSIGGASGAVFGTLFRAGASEFGGVVSFDSKALSLLLQNGLQGVKDRGKANVGDKTLVDALEPAALVARETVELPLAQSMGRVVAAAMHGMEKTKQMVANVGKAKTLGERSLGHPDPGALSMALMLSFMMEYVTGALESQSPV